MRSTLTLLAVGMTLALTLTATFTSGFITIAPTTTKSWRFAEFVYNHADGENIFRQHVGPLHAEREMNGSEALKAEAEALKAKAEKLRLEIEQNELEANRNPNRKTVATAATSAVGSDNDSTSSAAAATESKSATPLSPWAILPSGPRGEGDHEYRIYADIGREPGTWMDPRWGASGNRIGFSLDVAFLSDRPAAPEIAAKMISDNKMGARSEILALDTAGFARLREGFDRMECKGGAYRIDKGKGGTNTIRMVIEVEGTTKADQSYVYGDVSVPPGYLYFSLPVFGSGTKNLSIKEGLISVRQVGWHTGWRREESRICGVFTAKSLPEAKIKDQF